LIMNELIASYNSEELPSSNSNKSYSWEQKKIMVHEIRNSVLGYNFAMDKYGINYWALRKYTKALNKQLPMFETKGRPCKFDEISVAKVNLFLSSRMDAEASDLYGFLKQEWKETLTRRYTNGIPNNVNSRISKTSLWRWSRKLLHNYQLSTSYLV